MHVVPAFPDPTITKQDLSRPRDGSGKATWSRGKSMGKGLEVWSNLARQKQEPQTGDEATWELSLILQVAKEQKHLNPHLVTPTHFLSKAHCATHNWINRWGLSVPQNIIQPQKKETKHWHISQHGWTLRTLRCMKEARYKRANIAWFHLYEPPTKGKFMDTESRVEVTRGCGEEVMGVTV